MSSPALAHLRTRDSEAARLREESALALRRRLRLTSNSSLLVCELPDQEGRRRASQGVTAAR